MQVEALWTQIATAGPATCSTYDWERKRDAVEGLYDRLSFSGNDTVVEQTNAMCRSRGAKELEKVVRCRVELDGLEDTLNV